MNRNFFIFLSYCFFFAVFFFFVDFIIGKSAENCINYAIKHNPKSTESEIKKKNAINSIEEEAIIIGASDAAHSYITNQIEDSISISTYNLGFDGCFFVFQNCLINMILDRYIPKLIIWEMVENGLGAGNEEDEYKSLNFYYQNYDNHYCKFVLNYSDPLNKYKLLIQSYRYNSQLLSYINSFIVPEDKLKGYVPLPSSGYKYPEIKYHNEDYELSEFKVNLLKGTIKRCNDLGVKLIFAFAPRFIIGEKNTKPFYELKRIATENNIPFIDSQKYEIFFKDNTLYKDAGHVNDKGAREYMKYFIPELKQILNISQ